MRGRTHDRRELTTVESRRVASELHALDHLKVLFKIFLPLRFIQLSQCTEFVARGIAICVADDHVLLSTLGTTRNQQDCKNMVSVNAVQNVGIERNVLGRRQSFFREPVEVAEGPGAVAQRGSVYGRTLPGESPVSRM